MRQMTVMVQMVVVDQSRHPQQPADQIRPELIHDLGILSAAVPAEVQLAAEDSREDVELLGVAERGQLGLGWRGCAPGAPRAPSNAGHSLEIQRGAVRPLLAQLPHVPTNVGLLAKPRWRTTASFTVSSQNPNPK